MPHRDLPSDEALLATLLDEGRLALLAETGLPGSPPEEIFELFTRLAARLTNSPTSLLTFVDDARQYFKSAVGLHEPWATRRTSPLTHSFCKYVVALNAPLVVDDAREHPVLRLNRGTTEAGIVAYAGVPIYADESRRHPIGALCVIDGVSRTYDDETVKTLSDLAMACQATLDARLAKERLGARERVLEEAQSLARFGWFFIDAFDEVLVLSKPLSEHLLPPQALQTALPGDGQGGRRIPISEFRSALDDEGRSAFDAARAQALAEGAARCEVTYVFPGAARRHLSIGLRRFLRSHGNGIVGAVSDVTDERLREVRERSLDLKLAETQRLESLGVLAGGVAHDFNNLLGVVMGASSLLRIEHPNLEGPDAPLHQIETAARRASELATQLLSYAGRSNATLTEVDGAALVGDTLTLLGAMLPKRTRLVFRTNGGPAPVLADSAQLRQVILNLVLNASEALEGKDGVVDVETRVEHVARDAFRLAPVGSDCLAGRYFVVSVRDHGTGIAEQHLPRIFEPFFTTKLEGRGLGLSAVLGIVRRHAGALVVESSVDGEHHGTTFRVYLPLAANATAPVNSSDSTPAVLVVDDEAALRNLFGRMMKHLGFKPLLAASGREALSLHREHGATIALAILDLTMPDLDGVQTQEHLAAQGFAAPTLFVSGYAAPDDIADLTAGPNVRFLQKPFTIPELEAAIAAILPNREKKG